MTGDAQGLGFLAQIFELANFNQQPLIIVENPKYTHVQLLIESGKANSLTSEEWNEIYGEKLLLTIGNATAEITGFYPHELMEAYVTLKVKLQLEKELQRVQGIKQSNNVTA
jgi:hypothetical protein